jgi:hypothetical protein
MSVTGNPINVPNYLTSYTPYIKTKQDLKAYIWRKLGGEANNIELTDANLNDAIDETLEIFMKYAYDGMMERYLPINLVQGTNTYTLPYETFAVLGVHTSGIDGGIIGGVPTNMFSINQYVASDLFRGGKIDLLTYEMVNNMLSTIDVVFGKKVSFEFNSISRVLNLFEKPSIAEPALVHVYMRNVPTYDQSGNESSNIYNEIWVRQFSTEKARHQWAINLMKFGGSNLPGGVVLNVEAMLNEANTNIERLTTQLMDENTLPVAFFIG